MSGNQETTPPQPLASTAAANSATDERLTALSAGLIERDLVKAEDADKDGFDPVTVALAAIDAGKAENATLARQVAGQKGVATKARKELAEVEEALRETGARARAIGPVDDEALSPRDLLALIGEAETAEVVASDGKKELTEIASLRINGTPARAFRVLPAGLALTVPQFQVHAPQKGKKALQLAGWGLLLDGELVAYRARHDTLTLGGGQTYNLAGDVLL